MKGLSIGSIYDHGAKLIEERNSVHERDILVSKQSAVIDNEGSAIGVKTSEEEPKKVYRSGYQEWRQRNCEPKVQRDGE